MTERELAEEFFGLAREYCSKLNGCLQKAQELCSPEEFEQYRTGVAYVMGYSHEHIMEPIVKQYPDLEPEEWKGDDELGAELGKKVAASVDARRSRESNTR